MVQERKYGHICVHMGGVSNAYFAYYGEGSCTWLGRNGMRGHVHREGLDGTGDGNEAWRTAKRRKRTSYVQNGVLLIGSGVAYRKANEIDLCWSATVETGVLFIRRGVAYHKTEETNLC